MRLPLTICAIVFGFLTTAAALQAGEVRSKPGGGNWNDVNTWVGGTIPGENDDVVIQGTVAAKTATVRSVTVQAGATLTGMGGPQYLTVTDHFTNNGTVTENPDNWTLAIYTRRALVNNGRFEPTNVEFKEGSGYEISGTGVFGANRMDKRGEEELRVLSDVTLASYLYLAKPDWTWSAMSLNGHRITLDGSSGRFNAGVLQGAVIAGPGAFSSTGTGWLMQCTISGAIDLYDVVTFQSGVTFTGPVTNHGKITNPAAPVGISFQGPFVNRGTIERHPDNWNLAIEAFSSIENHGTWEPTETVIRSDTNVTLMHAPGAPFAGDKFHTTDTLGHLVALSDLEFRCRFYSDDVNYQWATLDMRNHDLVLDAQRGSYGAGTINAFNVRNAGSVISRNDASFSRVTFHGNVHFRGYTRIGGESYAVGTVVNHDTLEGADGPNTIEVWGTFRNEGVIRQNAGNWQLNLILHGDYFEAGTMRDADLIVRTDGITRRISGTILTDLYVNWSDESATGTVEFVGDARMSGSIRLPQPSTLRVPPSGHLKTHVPLSLQGSFQLQGRLTEERSVAPTGADLQLTTMRVRIPATTGVDTLDVTCSGRGTPQSFSGAVQRWWSLTTHGGPPATATSMRFYLGDADLNGNDISTLHVFHSADSGVTWSQKTTNAAITRNADERWIEFQDALLDGMYVLSSRPDPTSVLPGVLVNILGSDAIRIGAPNRLTFHATNVGTTTTPTTLMPVFLGSKLHILGGEIPLPGGGSITLTKDDLAQGDNGEDDSTMMMVLAPLEPQETVMFDLIITADPPTGMNVKSGDRVQLEPVTTIAATTLILWVGGKAVSYVVGKGIDYLGDKAQENIELSDAELKKYAEALGVREEQIRIRKAKDGVAMEVVKFTGGEVTTYLLKGGVGTGVAVGIGDNMAKKVAPSLRQRIFNWFYKDIGLIKPEPPSKPGRPSFQLQPGNIAVKQGRAVTSRDPNDKTGPSGPGLNNYVRTGSTMHYRIRFENVKDAEAAAYRIVVRDTLDAASFDISTARPLRTSHAGAIFTQVGNVFTWEWVGIDLPPNVVPPEGEGFVDLAVNIRQGKENGVTISNSATITFDLNDPIHTNTWVNVVDADPPRTGELLVRQVADDSVECYFTARDGHSGVASSAVFVSSGEPGSPFALGAVTFRDAAVIANERVRFGVNAADMSQLRFYVLSSDGVGNREFVPQQIVGITPSGVEEQMTHTELDVWPSPATSELHLATTTGADIGEFWVFNVHGTLVLNGKGAGTHTISVQGLAPGAYFVVTSNGSVSFVVQR